MELLIIPLMLMIALLIPKPGRSKAELRIKHAALLGITPEEWDALQEEMHSHRRRSHGQH